MKKKKLFILLIFDLIYGAGWLIGKFLAKTMYLLVMCKTL